MKSSLVFTICFSSYLLNAQEAPKAYYRYIKKGDSLYTAHDFGNSAQAYSQAFKAFGWKGFSDDRYNAACSWALSNKPDSAFFQLHIVANRQNYSNLKHITTDSDLNSLHSDKRWKPILEVIQQNKEKQEAKLNKPLAARLDTIFSDDQTGRLELDSLVRKHGWGAKEVAALSNSILKKDSINLVKVRAILDTYGWLGSEVIGSTGNTALFLVIQHGDLQVQEKYLPMMREAVKAGNAKGSSLALLEDRVALRQGRKQIYGSQIGMDPDTKLYYVLPLEDPDHVDIRRTEVGLPPIDNYISRWQLKWDVEQYKKDLPAIEAKERSKKK